MYEEFAKACPRDKRVGKAHANAAEYFETLGGDADGCDGDRRIPMPRRRAHK
jgi:hypothetical protein